MGLAAPRFRSASFLVAALCYLLPFLTVSCPAGSRTVSGLQLAVGTTIQQPQMFGPPRAERIDGEPLALAALVCASVGVLVGLARGARWRLAAAVLALAGGVLLLCVRSKVGGEAQRAGLGMLVVEYEAGYWIAMAAFLFAFVSAWATRAGLVASQLPPVPAPETTSS